MITQAHFETKLSGPYVSNSLESIPIDPEPVNGRRIINSVSSVGMPKILKIGDAKFARTEDNPLIERSSTTAKIATKYGKVLMQRLTACFPP